MVAPSSQSGKLIGGRFGRESRHGEAGVLHPNHMGGGPVAIDGWWAENDAAAIWRFVRFWHRSLRNLLLTSAATQDMTLSP
jgi:hypothetical protein